MESRQRNFIGIHAGAVRYHRCLGPGLRQDDREEGSTGPFLLATMVTADGAQIKSRDWSAFVSISNCSMLSCSARIL